LRNRWYDPQTGRFLSEDPIGLEGGINLYQFALGDPINFRDPFGLIVCFGEDGRQTLIDETEKATGSDITIDESSGCIKSITGIASGLQYGLLRNRLRYLQASRHTFTVAFRSGRSEYDPWSRTAWISKHAPFAYDTPSSDGKCNSIALDEGYAGAIAHELLGHAYDQDTNVWGYVFRGQRLAIAAENAYFGATGGLLRCDR
jgi:hypothetical protein